MLAAKVKASAAVAEMATLRALASPMQIGQTDLARLSSFDENGILTNLKVRFQADQVYTYIGSILIAMNPYTTLPTYNTRLIPIYAAFGSLQESPHVYGFASHVYRNMLLKTKDQSVVISGESGAGKTESATYFVTALSQLAGRGDVRVKGQLVSAGHLLEMFGNAKTIRNRNSSRFGKFMFIQFDRFGKLRGATITSYLLEKSRIVMRSEQERTFHIFYALLSGATEEERYKYRLGSSFSNYSYIISSVTEAQQTNDEENFARVKELMLAHGIDAVMQSQIFSLLSAILQIGNIGIAASDDDTAIIANENAVNISAELLHISPASLTAALTRRTLLSDANADSIQKNLTAAQASDARDALAKELYHKLWTHLVRVINASMQHVEEGGANEGVLHIGVLDIFGFENFPTNSLEQLCINYANERMFQFFNYKLFQVEQEEYKFEGIDWKYIDYNDNKDTITMLTKRPVGIFDLIDEYSMLQNMTDTILLGKIRSEWGNHACFQKPTNQQMAQTHFVVKHFAAPVEYEIAGFISKNSDTFHGDMLNCLRASSSAFIRTLFEEPQEAADEAATPITPAPDAAPSTPSSPSMRGRPSISGSPAAARPPSIARTPSSSLLRNLTLRRESQMDRNSKKRLSITGLIGKSSKDFGRRKEVRTVGTYFKDSLELLLARLESSDTHFICCIKPNDQQKPQIFHDDTVAKELNYLGVMQTVRLRREGYPLRLTFDDFYRKYWVINPRQIIFNAKSKVTPKMCSTLLAALGYKEKVDYQVGKTKLYMKFELQIKIEELYKNKVSHLVVLLQSCFRMSRERREYVALRRAVVTIQTAFRKREQRRMFAERQQQFRVQIEADKAAAFAADQFRRLKQITMEQKNQERELIKQGLRQIDDQEKYQDPRKQLRAASQFRMLSSMLNIDPLRLKLLFLQSPKGFDRREFLNFLPEISRLRTDIDTEEQEQALTGIFGIFDSDHDGRVHLKDVVTVLGRLAYGDVEDRLAMGYRLFDPEHYGDFSRENLRTVIEALTSLMVTRPVIPKALRRSREVRTAFVQVHFDTTVVQDQAFTGYSTLQISSDMNTQKVIKAVLEKKQLSMNASNIVLFEIRVAPGNKIVYQRKIASPEKPLDAFERWKLLSVEQHMRFLLVKDTFLDKEPAPAVEKPKTGTLRKMFGRAQEKTPQSLLPFSRVDMLPHGVVQVFFSKETTLASTSGRRSLRDYQYKSVPIDAHLTAQGLINNIMKRASAGQEGAVEEDYILYEVRFGDLEAMNVCYERPLAPSEMPIQVMANTSGSEEVCRFVIQKASDVIYDSATTAARQREIYAAETRALQASKLSTLKRSTDTKSMKRADAKSPPRGTMEKSSPTLKRANDKQKTPQEPPASPLAAAPGTKHISVYLENPELTPITPRPRAKVEFVAHKRIAVADSMTAEELKQRIAEAVHVDASRLDEYAIHEVQQGSGDGKSVEYERILLPDERPLLRSRGNEEKSRSKHDLVLDIPQFLLVGPYSGNARVIIRADDDESADAASDVQLDFVDVFVDSVFAGRDAYMDRNTLIEVGSSGSWVADYLGLRAFFKRNRFTNVRGF